MNTPRPPLMPLDEARSRLLSYAAALGRTEEISTFDADGRVLTQQVVSPLQVPPQDNSSMDGYAVRCAEVAVAGVVLPVSQRIPAGQAAQPLAAGTVARIFTGAPVPAGADAVVMQEDVQPEGEGRVRIAAVPANGQWIRRSGEDVTRGSTVLAAGTRLGPAALGMAAGVGAARLRVATRPRVALFSTGDELVMPGEIAPEAMRPGAIYNSNRFFLRALLLRSGCAVTDLGIVPDSRAATIEALRGAAQSHDLILTSGGVSVGEEDHIKPSVEALGSIEMWQVAMKPGKPFAYGSISGCHFIGLPGNPVSSFVTFGLLVRPFVLKLQGANALDAQPVPMRSDFDWPRADKRREFLRARRNAQGGLDLFPNQSSGVLTSTVWGDGVVDNPSGKTIARGDTLQFLPFAEWLA